MLMNYFKIALRNLKNYRAYTAINIVGLAVGLACCIAIMLFVSDELSYDRFNSHADRIYRIHFRAFFNGKDLNFAGSAPPLAPTLVRDFPEVLAVTRVAKFSVPAIRYKGKSFNEERFFLADSTFFDVFTVRFAKGDPKSALVQPNGVVITEEMAEKYFGDEDPMGKIINADRTKDYVVTGVVDGFPRNSHFRFDFLGSLTGHPGIRDQVWVHPSIYTYALFREGTEPSAFEKKMNDDLRKYIGPQVKAVAGLTFDEFESKGNLIRFNLQPMTSIHLHSHLDYEIEANSDIAFVYILSAIAVAILLVACINFMNLSTARSERRAKEVGIRKTLGSNRARLIAQFMTESMVLSVFSVLLAMGLIELLLPLFNEISGKQVGLDLLGNARTIPVLGLLAIIVGILAGSYPSFYLSSFTPSRTLNQVNRKGGHKSLLRSTLVVSQFVVSIVLLISTLVIYSQLKYIQDRDLGFDRELVVVVRNTDKLGQRVGSFENELRANSAVLNVTNSSDVPGDQNGNNTFKPEGSAVGEARSLRTMQCDYDFANTYRIKMVAGRFFSQMHPSDSMAVVLNESAVKSLNLSKPIGTNLMVLNGLGAEAPKMKIVGIMRDFNYQSLHEEVRPLVVGMFPRAALGRFMSVRIAPQNLGRAVSSIQDTWKKYAGDEAFVCNFMDQTLEHQYRADIRTGRLAAMFSILAIFIACLGLLGLAAFMTERRTKEIGIRKVLGASVTEVIALLVATFTKWLLIANIVAWPLAYFAIDKWLQNFAYRTDISLWSFVASGGFALLVALATVSLHAIKAATANPVDALKYE
jgi:putative ABC transport system permease protein